MTEQNDRFRPARDDLNEEIARLTAINADMLDALRGLCAFMIGPTEEGDRYCIGCGSTSDADDREPERHGDSCPVLAARAAIAKAMGEEVKA